MPYAAGELCLQHNHTPVAPTVTNAAEDAAADYTATAEMWKSRAKSIASVPRACPKQASTAAAGKRKAQAAGCTPKPILYPSDIANSASSFTIEGSEHPE